MVKGPLREWIVSHDESKVFIVVYLTLAVLLSVFLGLFWLVLVVLVHYVLEVIKQAQIHEYFVTAIFQSLYELKLDISLIVFALAVSVYSEVVFGAAGIGPGARLVAQAGSRFAAWEYIIKAILFSVDDVAQVVKGVKVIKKDRKKEITEKGLMLRKPVKLMWGSWGGKWNRGTKVSIIVGLFSLLTIITAPLFTEYTYDSLWRVIVFFLSP